MTDINLNLNNIMDTTNIQRNNTKSLEDKLSKANDSKDDKALIDACKEFESIFTHMLLKNMRATIPDGGLTEKSSAREIFEDMYDQEMANSMSKSEDGIGLAKILYEQMKYRR